MKQELRHASGRGFTLVEMLTAVAIVGLITLLIGVEFDASIENLLHTRSNRDNEANSRLVMTKLVNRLRTASPWVFNPNSPGSPIVILDPIPTATPGATSTVLQFYRVHPGSLTASPIPTMASDGSPNPAYDVVTIQRGPCTLLNPPCTDPSPSPNYLIESVTDAQTSTPGETLVLGRDVTAFSVTGFGNQTAATLNISLTVSSTSSRCFAQCSYTSNNSVFVEGVTSANL